MKKLRFAGILFAVAILFAGCIPAQTPSASAASSPILEEIDSWPVNTYTQAIPKPESGTPQFQIFDEEKGYYAITLEIEDRAQGEAYLQTLSSQGFREIAGESEKTAIGQIYRKDNLWLSVSVSDHALGIYVALEQDYRMIFFSDPLR